MGDMADYYMDREQQEYDEMDFAELPGGWCVPPDQAPELRSQNSISPELAFVRAHPVTAQRGGIKYPKRKEPMSTNKRDPEYALKLTQKVIAALQQEEAELQKQIAQAKTVVPRPAGNRYRVHVYFGSHGKRYEFLLLRCPDGRWFTTGTSEETKSFRDWPALVAWLEGPDVHSHSDLIELADSGTTYNLKTGAQTGVPF